MKLYASILFALLLVGSISQSYIQTQNTITQITDYTKYVQELENETGQEIGERVQKFLEDGCDEVDPEYKCKVDGLTLALTKKFETGRYFILEKKEDIFSTRYTLNISSLPNKIFSNALPADRFMRQKEAIDLTNKEKNRVIYETQFNPGGEAAHIVYLPGTITRAAAGSYEATIDGSKAEFDLLEVFKDSEVIVVESQKTNTGLLLVILILSAIIASTVHFKTRNYDKKRKRKT